MWLARYQRIDYRLLQIEIFCLIPCRERRGVPDEFRDRKGFRVAELSSAATMAASGAADMGSFAAHLSGGVLR
ncbi:hypothetical protein GCM10010520_13920 [Rhizobium viscosum]